MKKRRACLPQRQVLDGRITEQIISWPDYQKAKNILCYASLPEEAGTMALIEHALTSAKNVFLPRCNGNNLVICQITALIQLEKGAFDVLEPIKQCPLAGIEEMDLALVPGLAFDETGYRLGYGKGYYDRLLKDTKVQTLGVFYSMQLVQALPRMPHDQPVKALCSEIEIGYIRST